MISHKRKFISVAVLGAVLLATVAVARTVHTHAAGPFVTIGQAVTGQSTSGQATRGRTFGATAGQVAPSGRLGNFACALPNVAACQNIETWLPE
jgi:hypothetical protein